MGKRSGGAAQSASMFIARCTDYCLTRTSATANQVILAQELAEKCLRLTNLEIEIPTTKTAISPWITEVLC